MKKIITDCILLFIIGLCVGLLTGLSISPVIQTVLSSILGISIAVVSILSGLESKSENSQNMKLFDYKINIFPLTLLVLGITLGAIGGIYARTHDVLGQNSTVKVEIKKQDKNDISSTVLFSNNYKPEICDIVAIHSGKTLIHELLVVDDSSVNKLIDSLNSNPELVKQKLILECGKLKK